MILHQTQKQGLAHDPSGSPRTTIVACLVQDGYAFWSFVGDSRLYVIRDGRILTRTRDHTPCATPANALPTARGISRTQSIDERTPAISISRD